VTGPVFLPTLLRTACVICGSEKTTVCRIFSCQRTGPQLAPTVRTCSASASVALACRAEAASEASA
jgi:hypothetical protein